MEPRTLALASSDRSDTLGSNFITSYAGIAAFIAVAREGSFARAGERLGIGRSAVSRSVLRLETQLDARLFVRTTRSTALTPEGELFYAQCLPGVERIREALESVRALRSGPPQGVLRIGATPAFGRKVVAPMLRDFRAMHPGIVVELQLDDHTPDLGSGSIDVVFCDGEVREGGAVGRKLMPMRLVTCASPDYADRQGLPRFPDELAVHRTLGLRATHGGAACWEFLVDGKVRQADPQAGLVFNDAELVLQSALDGDGIAQLPEYLVESSLRTGQLVACLARFAPDEKGHFLSFLGGRQMPARVRTFVDYMVGQFEAQQEWDAHRTQQTLAGKGRDGQDGEDGGQGEHGGDGEQGEPREERTGQAALLGTLPATRPWQEAASSPETQPPRAAQPGQSLPPPPAAPGPRALTRARPVSRQSFRNAPAAGRMPRDGAPAWLPTGT